MTETTVKLSGLQKAMSRQMVASWTETPQFHLETEVDCAAMVALRKLLPYRPSYTVIIAKAVANALLSHPNFNASWGGDHIVRYDQVNVAIAMDTRRGLLTPVLFDAACRTLEEIHAAFEGLKQKSERGNFTQEELAGGTFTVSNLGMYRINAFSAIVNPPQAAILAIPRMQNVPVVMEDGTVGVRKIMRPTLSLDHRLVDGAGGARFLMEVIALLEEPRRMLSE